MRKRKVNLWILIVFPIFAYIGYVIGIMVEVRAAYEDVLYYFIHPFPITMTGTTKSFIFIGLLIGLAILLKYFAGLPANPRLSGKEYGTARFEDPSVIAKKMGQDPAKILSANTRLSTNDRKTGLNDNLLLIGGSGAGKSFRFIKPNILHCDNSMVITDPKGECLRDTGQLRYPFRSGISGSGTVWPVPLRRLSRHDNNRSAVAVIGSGTHTRRGVL